MEALNLQRQEAPLRRLMGPGPLDVHPRVYKALSSPVIGYLDPVYLKVLDRIGELLPPVFGTQNRVANAMPGTGSSGMEACIANLIEPGDPVLISVNGFFGDRIRQMAERQQADITAVETEWGKPVDPERVEAELKKKPYKLIALVHAETSTGVLQPIDDIAHLAELTRPRIADNGAPWQASPCCSLQSVCSAARSTRPSWKRFPTGSTAS